ncbi:DUF3757 domain-containing protein [Vibrio mediterranei]|nr:DUF3757 domain-containing protein [Vibrio mediterranei]
MFPIIVITVLGMLSPPVYAQMTVASCPPPFSIKVINASYSGYNNIGSWFGVVIPASEYSGNVTSFRSVTVFGSDGIPLKLHRCSYNLENGIVDLFLVGDRHRHVSIENYSSHWKSVYLGGWINVYECRDDAESCLFDIEDSKAFF